MTARTLGAICAGILAGLTFLGTARAEVKAPEDLDAVRWEAMNLVQAGQRTEAAVLLLDTLRSLPADRADLAFPAVGAVQLLTFINEYLMTQEECEALYALHLDEKRSPMEKFLATLFRYMDDAGLSQEEVNQCARDLLRLTQCDHLPVRLGALFTMSSPYYFYDTTAGQRARDFIILEFPGEYLAQEAQRLNLYYARTGKAEGLREALERTTDAGELRAHSLRMREDPVGGAIQAALESAASAEQDAACVTALAQAAAQAPGWAEEYAALNILEGFHGGPLAAKVRGAATAAIARNRDSRAVFRARVIRMSIARNQGDAETLLEDAHALLDTDPIPVVPERNMYEELKNSIQQAADRLAELGRPADAIALLDALSARFPESLLAQRLTEKTAALSESKEAADR